MHFRLIQYVFFFLEFSFEDFLASQIMFRYRRLEMQITGYAKHIPTYITNMAVGINTKTESVEAEEEETD